MKWKIGNKLGLGFGICIAVIAGLVIFNLVQLNRLVKIEAEESIRSADAVIVEEAAAMGFRVYSIIADGIINRDIAEHRIEYEKVKNETLEDLKTIDNLVDTPEEKEWIKAATLHANNIFNLFDNELMPILLSTNEITSEIKRLDSIVDENVSEISEHLNLISDSVNEEMQEARERYASISKSVKFVSILLAIFGIIAAAFSSILVTRSIVIPLKKIARISDNLAIGDINQDLEYRSDDEIGQLADSFRKMIQEQKNKAEAAQEIARGNLKVEINKSSNSDLLGDAIVNIKHSLNVLNSDLNETINAQNSGDLEYRCHPEKLQGAYADLLSGINKTLGAVIDPVVEAIGILSEYAKGDLNNKLRDLPGKQMILPNTMNTIRNTLRDLVEEGVMLADAAKDGKLKTRAEVNKFEGAYRQIIEGMNLTIDNILEPIDEAIRSLEDMAEGDLTTYVQGQYKGDHARIKTSINTSLDSLNELLGEVRNAVDQVNNGSMQVSQSSQALSQGATEQASSLEEISASMTEIGSQSQANAENATQANGLAMEARDSADNGNSQMNNMLDAMREINSSSAEISKIIKVIDEIAFQTNLLALNAAVEAARAGVHGKGFAVVAEEVRNLAQRSATAAKETTSLIEGSTKKVEAGSQIANNTARALDEIVAGITKVNDLVGEIANASLEQSNGIEQMSDALGQVDQVTQANTSSAEESAAASEELSGQAQNLMAMISRFRLNNSGVTSRPQLETFKDSSQKTKAIKGNSAEVNPDLTINLDDNDFSDF